LFGPRIADVLTNALSGAALPLVASACVGVLSRLLGVFSVAHVGFASARRQKSLQIRLI